MSGPLASLFGALLSEMSARNEYSVFIDDAKRERILHGLFDNYYAGCTAEVVFDTKPLLVRVDAGNCEAFPRCESDCLRARTAVGARQHRAVGPAQRL